MRRPDVGSESITTQRVSRAWLSFDLVSVVLAVLFSAFIVVGASFFATDSPGWFAGSGGAAVGSLLVGVVIAAVLYLPIRLLYAWLDRRWLSGATEPVGGIISMRTAMRRWLLPTSGFIGVCWLLWLLIHYPGNVDSDTITQLFQWLGLAQKSDHHPWFDTTIFGWFWDFGHALGSYNIGLFAFLVVQVVATAVAMGLTLTYLGRLGLPVVPRRVLTAFVALFPTFPMSVTVMSKDSLAGVFWMPFVILYVEVLRTRGRVLARPWVWVAAVLLIVPLVLAKRSNVYVFVACVVVMLLVAGWRSRVRVAVGALVILILTVGLWPRVVLPALRVEAGTSTDMLSIPLQQTARVVVEHGSSLPASERSAINAVLRYQGLAKAYTPRRSDAVKGRWTGHASRAEKEAYARVWLAELTRYPGTYAAATANISFEYFAPVTRLDFQSDLNLGHYVPFWLSRSFKGTTRAQIDDVALALHSPHWLQPAELAFNRATAAFTTGNLLASKAFYSSWIPLLALGFALRRRSWLLALATFPMLLNLGVLIAGPIALPRYIIPLIQGSVLLVGLMLVPHRWLPRQDAPDQSAQERKADLDRSDPTSGKDPSPR